MTRTNIIKKTKRVVIKIGSSVLTNSHGPRLAFFKKLASEISKLHAQGLEIVLVSSGAIACGMVGLNLKKRPTQISQKQASAAVGQPILMQHYMHQFARKKIKVAQVLLTRDDLHSHSRFLTAQTTMMELLREKVLPIVNENDSIAVEEIQFGDNDQLSALVAHLVNAHLLLILTDIDGLYDKDPKKNKDANLISLVDNIHEKIFKGAEDTTRPTSTGGMITKIKAAQKASSFGIPTWIIKGENPDIISEVFKAKELGTLFLSKRTS